VFVAERASPTRTTKYDLVTASLGETYVSVDDRLPMELVSEALEQKALPEFQQYSSIRREVPRGRSRLDFLLSSRSSQCFLEVKSVTLVRKSVAFFPDAPTERGRLHVESLVWAKKEGYEAAIILSYSGMMLRSSPLMTTLTRNSAKPCGWPRSRDWASMPTGAA